MAASVISLLVIARPSSRRMASAASANVMRGRVRRAEADAAAAVVSLLDHVPMMNNGGLGR